MQDLGESTLGEFFGAANVPADCRGRRFWLHSPDDAFAGLADAVGPNTPGHVSLVTIHGDMSAGDFPAILDSVFRDDSWDFDRRFHIREALKADASESFVVGSCTFELDLSTLSRIVDRIQGNAGGANREFGGVVVLVEVAGTYVTLDPFDSSGPLPLAEELAYAFRIDRDFLDFGGFVPIPDRYGIQARLGAK